DQSRRKDCRPEFAKVRGVLEERLRVPVPLEDDALGLIVAEVDLVLQRPGVLGPYDLHGLSGQALELLELAVMKPEPTDPLKLTHFSCLRSLAAPGAGAVVRRGVEVAPPGCAGRAHRPVATPRRPAAPVAGGAASRRPRPGARAAAEREGPAEFPSVPGHGAS